MFKLVHTKKKRNTSLIFKKRNHGPIGLTPIVTVQTISHNWYTIGTINKYQCAQLFYSKHQYGLPCYNEHGTQWSPGVLQI